MLDRLQEFRNVGRVMREVAIHLDNHVVVEILEDILERRQVCPAKAFLALTLENEHFTGMAQAQVGGEFAGAIGRIVVDYQDMDSTLEFSDRVHQSLEIVELVIGGDNGDDPHDVQALSYQRTRDAHHVCSSVFFGHESVLVIGRLISVRLLPLRKLHLFRRYRLVRNHAKQMCDAVQSRTPLVVRFHNVPRSELAIGSREKHVPGPRVVIPPPVRFQVHGAELPTLAGIGHALVESPCLLLLTDFEPVFHQDDSIVCDETLEGRADAQEPLILLLRAESHDVLDARPVIPAPVEDHDLAGSRKMRNETLHVHLRLLTLGWRRQSENLEYARAHSLRYGFDDATFSGRVPSLEYH